MSDIKSFAVIGGDKRMLYCADALREDGFEVFAAVMSGDADCMSPQRALQQADALILPIPLSKDGENIFAPLYGEKINGKELLKGCSKPVFFGNNSLALVKKKNFFCYGEREDFKAANALPTAEGAIGAAIREYDGCITEAQVLVIGFGRIGRVLSAILSRMGADVSVSARKNADMEMISSLGMKAVHTHSISGKYDLVFNTVPAPVLGERELSCVNRDAVIIDLASMPGGTDDDAARKLGIPVHHELSLPGRTAPGKAGSIIKNTVLKVIEEEKL